MPRKPSIHSGDRFGRLVAADRVRGASGLLLWRFICDCGNEVISNGQPMLRTSGAWQSCGCFRAEKRGEKHPNYSHGMKQTRVYRIWNAMRQRCHNPNQPHYSRYGGLGVIVCERWRQSFVSFYEDMGEPTPDQSLDRIDPHGNYEPDNCRWATASQQRHNRRS